MHIGIIDWQDRAFNLIGQARIIPVVVADIFGLTCRFSQKLAAVRGFNLTQMRAVFSIRSANRQIGQQVE